MQMLLPPFKMRITEQLAVHLNELKRLLQVHGVSLVNTLKGGRGGYIKETIQRKPECEHLENQ